MAKATLVIMAAGIGSRFGKGIKQLEPVGPKGEIIMDYSIYDAIESGFDKVVFVIRRDLEEDFKEIIGKRIEKYIEVGYAYQEIEDIPERFRKKFQNRKKPWGTGQAILSCKGEIESPFLVINADDYYGKQAYKNCFEYLTGGNNQEGEICMSGFVLGNTLSDNGTVTRGICQVDEEGMLVEIKETKHIARTETGAAILSEAGAEVLDVKSHVSMNMWGLHPEFIKLLKQQFEEFLEELPVGDEVSEYLLPSMIGGLLEEGKIRVRVLESSDKWFGVTYREDKEIVVEEIKKLIASGVYPEGIFK